MRAIPHLLAMLLLWTSDNCFALAKELPKVPPTSKITEAGTLKSGPFAGLELTKIPLDAAKRIYAANADFQKVLKNEGPTYSVQDGMPMSDGGTTHFNGAGYRLVRVNSLTTIAGVRGVTVGVTIIFDEDRATEPSSFTQTRFLKLD